MRSKYTNTENGNLITDNSQPAHILQNVLGEKAHTSVLKREFVQFCLRVGVRVIIPANLSRVCPLFYLQIYRA